jgi:hypothetical protein
MDFPFSSSLCWFPEAAELRSRYCDSCAVLQRSLPVWWVVDGELCVRVLEVGELPLEVALKHADFERGVGLCYVGWTTQDLKTGLWRPEGADMYQWRMDALDAYARTLMNTPEVAASRRFEILCDAGMERRADLLETLLREPNGLQSLSAESLAAASVPFGGGRTP